MKTVILAGGLGTRISEESHLRPKPMIEIGQMPMLVHIMKIYDKYGFNDFVICGGYKQQVIKEYFSNLLIYTNDVTFDYKDKETFIHKTPKYDWRVTVSDTGYSTQTGGRIKRVEEYIGNETFLLTYGDAVGDVNLEEVLKSHKSSGKLATICVYNFGQSKGIVEIGSDGIVESFREKSDLDGDLINIGFMVVESEVLKMIENDNCNFEKDILPKLAEQKQLNSYIHKGFWQCMDTLKEKEYLEKLFSTGNAPWTK